MFAILRMKGLTGFAVGSIRPPSKPHSLSPEHSDIDDTNNDIHS